MLSISHHKSLFVADEFLNRISRICFFLFILFFLARFGVSQMPDCYHAGTCSYWTSSGDACNLRMGYSTCEGSHLNFRKDCYASPYTIRDCGCACDNGGPPAGFVGSISYTYIPTNSIVIETYQCGRLCPTSTPSPSPTPSPPPDPPWECDPTGYEQDWCENVQCNEWDPYLCQCVNGPPGECGGPQAGPCCSPVVIDVSGNGFNLTNAVNGVLFDLNGDGTIVSRMAWTSVNSDDAWLTLDRDGNGLVESGAELFGNFTPQPPSTEKNGFLALAVFDELANGGNNDGEISAQDSIFVSLRLWQDRNHNGISESNELFPLLSLGTASIDLDYKMSKHRDEHGNRFRYRAKVRDINGAQVGRWAWDVFLRSETANGDSVFTQDLQLFSLVESSCSPNGR